MKSSENCARSEELGKDADHICLLDYNTGKGFIETYASKLGLDASEIVLKDLVNSPIAWSIVTLKKDGQKLRAKQFVMGTCIYYPLQGAFGICRSMPEINISVKKFSNVISECGKHGFDIVIKGKSE